MATTRIGRCASAVLAAALLHAVPGAPQSAAAPQKPPASQRTVASSTVTVEPLASPATGETSAPQITTAGDRMMLSWLARTGGKAALTFARRTPTGWSPPSVVIASEHLVTNWADVPSVRVFGNGLAAHWLEMNGDDPEGYDVKISTSGDGKSWTPAISPHRDGTKTQHGFASFFASGKDSLGVAWLDGRNTAGGKGAMTLRAAGSIAGGPEVQISPRVCDCCPTAAANTSEGAIVAFRNRTADEVRDIYVTRFDGKGWSRPEPVSRDGWKITGCPINGPAIAARGNGVAVAWFTVVNGAGRALVAFSGDAGRTFSAPVRVDDEGSTGRPQVALLPDGSALVSWIEMGKGPSELKVRRVERGGVRSPAARIAVGLGTQSPRMAVAGSEAVFAWTENSRGITRVVTARAKL